VRFRPHILLTLVRKDVARLVRNGPALMLLGLFVLVAFLLGSSGLVRPEPVEAASASRRPDTWIVHWEESDWVEHLKRRAPPELQLRFVKASGTAPLAYPPDICVIELHRPRFFTDRGQIRTPVHYRYPGADPQVLFSVTRWFLSASLEHLAEMPQFFETIQAQAPPPGRDGTRQALERVSVAEILTLPLIGTALLTTIQFFAACGLLVSLTAQERERGALRALLRTPATYFELVTAKFLVHGGLALGASALAMAALQPAALTSLLFWATMVALTCGYFAVGLLISAFAKNQAAPNLLSFAYLLLIGTLNLLGHRFEAFRFLSQLTFERYGLTFTLASLDNLDLGLAASLNLLRTEQFRMLVLLSSGLLLVAFFVGSRRMLRD